MKSINGNGKRMIKMLIWFPVLMVGVSAATFTQVIPEPAKLLLFGAFLMGLAFWGRKQLAGHGVRTTDYRTTDNRTTDNRTTDYRSTEQHGPQTTENGTTDYGQQDQEAERLLLSPRKQ